MERARDLVAFASDAAFALGEDQRIRAWNRAAEALLGHTASEVVGLPCAEIVAAILPDGGSVCCGDCEGFRGLRKCHTYAVSKCFAKHKDGSRIPVELSTIAVPAGDGDGTVALVLLHHRGAVAADAPADPRVTVKTLGRFSIAVGDCTVPVQQWTRRHAVQLFKYLVFHVGRPVNQERLIDLLWPEATVQQGRNRLKVTVYFLRQQFREAGLVHDIIATEDAAYVLRSDRVAIDSVTFQSLVREGRTAQDAGRTGEAIARFEAARPLYQGEYMEADRYDDWCTEERERLREMYLEALGRLADLFAARGEHASVAQVCQAALVSEPCREAVHQKLIGALMALGRSDRALAQYRRCRQLLHDELGVEPAAETIALAREIARSDRARMIAAGAATSVS